MNNNNNTNILMLILFVALTWWITYRNANVEPYDLLDGEAYDNQFYPQDHMLNYNSTLLPHQYSHVNWREPRYPVKKSPAWTNNMFVPEVDATTEAEVEAGKEAFNGNVGAPLSYPGIGSPYVPPSGRVHYDFNLAESIRPEGAQEMIESYYFKPTPYIEYDSWAPNFGRYNRLRY